MRWTLVLAAIAACGKSDPLPPPPAPPPPAESAKPPPPVTMAPAGDDGTCTLAVTGAATLSETTPATAESKFWMGDAEDRPRSGFLVTCKGTQLRLSLVSSPNTTVDYGAKTYSVKGKNPEVSVMGRVSKSLSDFAGEVKITAFDPSHIAGSIEVTAKQDKGGSVKISGTFDVKCAHAAKCRR